MSLTILEILYIVLIIFITIIGTLLTIALIRVIKVLGPAVQIANFYNKVKGVLDAYAQIPEKLKESIKQKFSSDKIDDTEEDLEKEKNIK